MVPFLKKSVGRDKKEDKREEMERRRKGFCQANVAERAKVARDVEKEQIGKSRVDMGPARLT